MDRRRRLPGSGLEEEAMTMISGRLNPFEEYMSDSDDEEVGTLETRYIVPGLTKSRHYRMIWVSFKFLSVTI